MNLLFRLLTIYYYFPLFLRRKILVKNIGQNDIVLDIGSGDKPFWRSDVIVDRYLNDDQQRHSGAMIYDKKKIFVDADVENLPFKDKVFDFAFCAHLLEHVENPEKAIKEITRVAKSGYIEVPNGIIDLFEPFPPHLWFCNYRDGKLMFFQKEKSKNFLIELTESFGRNFLPDSLFIYLMVKNQHKIFIELYWKDKLAFEVIRSKNPYKYTYRKNRGQEKKFSTKIDFLFYKFFYTFMTGMFYKKKDIDLDELLEHRK